MIDIVLLDENYDMLIKIFNILRKYDAFRVKSIYADLKSLKNYLISEKVDILIINYTNNDSIIRTLKQIKSKCPDIKIIAILEKAADLDILINKKIFLDEFIINKFDEDVFIQKLKNVSKICKIKQDLVNIKIEKILKKFKFNKTSRGYYYIVDCLNYCINNNYEYVTKFYEVCNSVASINNNCSADQLNWNMTKSIKSMSRLTDTEVLEKYFPFNPSLTTKSFINEILGIYYTIYRE